MLRLLNEGFIYSLIFGVLCYAFGLVPSIIIFGGGAIAFFIIVGFIVEFFGFIVEFFGDLL